MTILCNGGPITHCYCDLCRTMLKEINNRVEEKNMVYVLNRNGESKVAQAKTESTLEFEESTPAPKPAKIVAEEANPATDTQNRQTGLEMASRGPESDEIATPKALTSVEIEERQFLLVQRQASALAASTLVPKDYQGKNNVPNVMIALNMAKRLRADVMMVMQSMHVIHGRPSFSAAFLISTFNACGKFSSIKYDLSEDRSSCTAYCTELSTGDKIVGTTITLDMAKQEGWSTKSGSKWKTMPEQMLKYRAATFLIRSTAPEIALGFYTQDEVEDFT